MSELPELDRITDRVLAYRPSKTEQQNGDQMADTFEVELDGETYRAIEVDFEINEERWSRYDLMDGGTIRTRQIVYRIGKLVDDSGVEILSSDGRPIYHVQWLPTVLKISR